MMIKIELMLPIWTLVEFNKPLMNEGMNLQLSLNVIE